MSGGDHKAVDATPLLPKGRFSSISRRLGCKRDTNKDATKAQGEYVIFTLAETDCG